MDDLLTRSWWMLALRGLLAITFGVLTLIWPGLTLLALVYLFAAYALLTGAVAVIGAIRNRKSDDDWWLPLLLGIASLGAGVIAVVHPSLTALILILLIGANALLVGMFDIATAIRLRKTMHDEWILFVSGIASALFGALVMLFPAGGGMALAWMIAVYAILTGALLLALAVRLRSLVKTRLASRTGETNRRIRPDRRMAHAHL